jgi:peptidyl-prolyl cis-trans isomerase B (cyclophilin B)
MGMNVKKISLVIAMVLVSAFSIAPIQAAEKPTTVPGCNC